ncbi:hypothetical protein FNO01nite_10240 [Flavobacterium noncentrifugens]|uniref:DoxX protein n=1 Tax=Flavobacterium noncentrifugens TaxID=1128970 RepID=A0A1G8V864_9FLAO|nr:DoxX family membrane protein [Flavobacterium noncentrifugens]GEP50352.1 hypothetical protein FNO01nite_10240 [Flavobacterium noncentrifugens]SDJ61350.1 DoxX protein [Flavobacterium noncentrifugens]
MEANYTAGLKFKIFNIAIKLFLGGMLFYGGIAKFQNPLPKPDSLIEQVKSGQEIAADTDMLMIKNYIFGMQQTNYFWQFLGFTELFAGTLILSQIFSIAGAFIALPLTINIFLFHLFLEPGEDGELYLTLALLFANIWVVFMAYEKWKSILVDQSAIQFKAN